MGCRSWENEYVKEDGKWKIKKILFNRIFTTPFEDGWVKTPMTKIEFGVLRSGLKQDPALFSSPIQAKKSYHTTIKIQLPGSKN